MNSNFAAPGGLNYPNAVSILPTFTPHDDAVRNCRTASFFPAEF